MKTRKLLSVFLSIVMLTSVVPLGALPVFGAEIVDSGTCGENVTWALDSEGTLTISGTGEMKSSAFYNDNRIKGVSIESGVTSIGNYAFYYCTSLTSVTIGNSVTSIGNYAFYNCSSLTDVYYTGSEMDWKNIEIDRGNDCLTNATIHYNHVHTWSSGVVTKAATCGATGIKTYTCTVCGQTKTESIPKLTESVIDTSTIKEKDGSVYAAPGLTAADILNAAGNGAKILKADGTQLKSTEKVGSGMTLVKPDGTKETIIVKGDNDGDGEITASDARYTLRTAVDLETPNDWQKNASLVDSTKTTITASDARIILRASVKLETINLY